RTWTTTSPGPGSGSGTSSNSTVPGAVKTRAFTAGGPLRETRAVRPAWSLGYRWIRSSARASPRARGARRRCRRARRQGWLGRAGRRGRGLRCGGAGGARGRPPAGRFRGEGPRVSRGGPDPGGVGAGVAGPPARGEIGGLACDVSLEATVARLTREAERALG